MQQEADQWLPYDQDENDTADSDESIPIGAMGQNNFIQSTCIINGEFDSIELHGADLNIKLIHSIMHQIHARLKQIASNKIETTLTDIECNEKQKDEYWDITSSLSQIKRTLTSFRLIYVSMNGETLSLLLQIIELCQTTLTDIGLELLISIKQTIYAKGDEVKQIGLFQKIMSRCATLPKLESFGVDLINFPLECYKYFDYFRVTDTFLSLQTLNVYICKENCDHINCLLQFIENHNKLDAIRLIINNPENDGIWDELNSLSLTAHCDSMRFRIFNDDIVKFNLICFNIIDTLNKSQIRCETLKAFSFYHELSDDLMEYLYLSDFIAKHPHLCELGISLNSMSDASLALFFKTMHETAGLMENLEYLEIEFNKLDDYELADSFALVNPNDISYVYEPNDDDPILGDDSGASNEEVEENQTLEDEPEIKSEQNDTPQPLHSCLSNENTKEKHFGRDSVLELAALINKCPTLISLDLKCWFGVDLNSFVVLTQSIINHQNIQKIKMNNLQRNDIIFVGLANIFSLKPHSFINSLSINFNEHYLDALRREKYNIPDSFFASLTEQNESNESMDAYDISKQLRPKCEFENVLSFIDSIFLSQDHLLKYITNVKNTLAVIILFEDVTFPKDVCDILMDYLVFNHVSAQENMLQISLQSLPNYMKTKLMEYFKKEFFQKHPKWLGTYPREMILGKFSYAKYLKLNCIKKNYLEYTLEK